MVVKSQMREEKQHREKKGRKEQFDFDFDALL